jgi:hypothetical protein
MKRQEKKLRLREIRVRSFVTALDRDEQKEINGGTGTGQEGTEVPIFCRASGTC